MNLASVYAIRHKDTGRCYVGHTSRDPKRRFKEHLSNLNNNAHSSPHLQYAWNKYGESAFEFVVLEECSDEVKVSRENYHLQSLETFNAAPVGGSCLGVGRSEETREKIRQANLGKKRSSEACTSMSEWQQGRKLTEEHKKNIGLGQKGKVVSLETRARMSEAQMGNKNQRPRNHSDETRARISAALTGRKGNEYSEESKKKMSDARKAYWARNKLAKLNGS